MQIVNDYDDHYHSYPLYVLYQLNVNVNAIDVDLTIGCDCDYDCDLDYDHDDVDFVNENAIDCVIYN